jgi:hypothetical protein
MTTSLTSSRARAVLAAQHDILRQMIDRCEELVDEVEADCASASGLALEIARLRIAFDEHNRLEEQLLRPLLLDAEWLGAVRVSCMVEDHVEEHRAMRIGLAATPAGDLRGVLASLRDHLATEERYLVSRKVLRDDLAG